MAMATTSAAPVNRMPMPLISRSRSFGRKAMTTAPRVGRNTASVIADFSQPVMRAPSSEPGDGDGQDGHADEQEHGVALHIAGLDVLQQAAGGPRRGPHRVHGAVDALAVEQVHPARQLAGGPGR